VLRMFPQQAHHVFGGCGKFLGPDQGYICQPRSRYGESMVFLSPIV
jgi:hypothetical protein